MKIGLISLPARIAAACRSIMKMQAIVSLFLVIVSTTSAQQSIRLTGHWEYLRQDLGGIWEAVRPVGKGNPESVPVWQPVSLPHCVNAEDAVSPEGNYYRGPAWYRTRLAIHNPYSEGRTLLHFEGAGQKTEVYIYTTLVGTHTGGYDEWTVDITDAIKDFAKTTVCREQFKGEIPLSIRTDNSRDLEMIPSGLSDFNIYGGLYRYLNLVYAPSISIDHLLARTELESSGRSGLLHVKMLLNSSSPSSSNPSPTNVDRPGTNHADNPSFRVSIALLAPDGKPVKLKYPSSIPVAATSDTLLLPDIQLPSPRTWSPDAPALYTLITTLTGPDGTFIDTTHVGFRNYTFVDNGPFLLNGRRLLLKGTHRHEDHAGSGAAMTEELMRKEMVLMKEMGVNFIRLAHYQQSPIILHLCDSLGILVWEEIPWCRGGLGHQHYREQARRMLTNMITQHYDHPSVIIWGLGNENDWPGDFQEFEKDSIRAFMKELNTLSHRLDPWRMTAIRRCDFCKDIPDIYSPSIWAGWYRGIFTEYKSSTEQEFKKVRHFLHVEWGGDSHARRHSENPDKSLLAVTGGQGTDERSGDASLYGGAARVSKDGDWSESYICNLVDWHLKEQETMPWLTGTAQWVFKDFSTPLRPDNPIPFVNQKGAVERDLTPKEVYYVFQSWWSARPMAHIYGHTWPVRWGGEGEVKMVKVYSNCEEATLFLNGQSCGLRKRNGQDFPAAGLRWKIAFRKGPNTLRVIARKGTALVTDSLQFQYQTEKWEKPSGIRIEKLSGSDGIDEVAVQLVDAHGIPCLDATDYIRFGLTGDGRLIDNQGTSTGSSYVQAYNGRAIIRVRTAGGHSVISARSGSLPTVFLQL